MQGANTINQIADEWGPALHPQDFQHKQRANPKLRKWYFPYCICHMQASTYQPLLPASKGSLSHALFPRWSKTSWCQCLPRCKECIQCPTVAELNVPYALRLPLAALLQHRSFSASCTQKKSRELIVTLFKSPVRLSYPVSSCISHVCTFWHRLSLPAKSTKCIFASDWKQTSNLKKNTSIKTESWSF